MIQSGLLFDDAQEIALAEDDELVVIDFDLGAGIFAVVDFVARLHRERCPFARVEHFARANRQRNHVSHKERCGTDG